MITLLVTLIVFGVLVTIHEWGHFIVAKRQGIDVEVFSIGFGPMLLKYHWHNTTYTISLIPLGGYVKMLGDDVSNKESLTATGAFFSKRPWQRMKVAMAGPIMNYILAYFLFVLVFILGAPFITPRVGEVLKNKPAFLSGLKANDLIVAMNDKKVEHWNEVTYFIKRYSGSEVINFTINREGKQLNIPVTPEKKDGIFFIGIKPVKEQKIIRYNLGVSLKKAAQKLWFISFVTYESLYKMIMGKLSFKKSMTGPIGIFFITGETAKKGVVHIFNLMGLLSAALALFNFLPLPVLDGGHFVLYLIEWLRGKPLNLKIQEFFQKIGVILLLTLMVFVFYNDFVNFKIVSRIKGIFASKNKVNITEKVR